MRGYHRRNGLMRASLVKLRLREREGDVRRWRNFREKWVFAVPEVQPPREFGAPDWAYKMQPILDSQGETIDVFDNDKSTFLFSG